MQRNIQSARFHSHSNRKKKTQKDTELIFQHKSKSEHVEFPMDTNTLTHIHTLSIYYNHTHTHTHTHTYTNTHAHTHTNTHTHTHTYTHTHIFIFLPQIKYQQQNLLHRWTNWISKRNENQHMSKTPTTDADTQQDQLDPCCTPPTPHFLTISLDNLWWGHNATVRHRNY